MDAGSLIGRDREVAHLRGVLVTAKRGGGGAMVLASGEAGVGKTALAGAIAGHCRQAGMRVAWGACWEGHGGAPYTPWLTVLHALGRPTSDLGDLSLDDGPASRFRLFADVTAIIRDAAATAGLLIVLDDLHWADTESLLLLQSLASSIDDAPVTVLGLFRDQGIGAEQAALLRAIGQDRIAQTMTVTGLSDPDAALLAKAAVGHHLPEAVTAAIVERSAGNPLFIRELARLADTPGTATLPASVREVIGRRVAQLPGQAAGILRDASVLGRDFTASLVATISGQDVTEVLDAMDTAAAAGLVSAGGHTARFAHALTQEVLYTQIPAADRQRLHARAVEALASSGGPVDTLAYHLRAAAPLLGTEPAVRTTLEAARQADRQLGYEHAADQFRAALGLMAEGPTPERAGITLELARCEFRAGAVGRAWRSCQAAAGIGRAIAAPDIVADAATVLRGLPNSVIMPQISALCREALAGLPPTDTVRTARVMAQLALSMDPFGATEPGLGRQALLAAEACGDPFALSLALHARYLELRNVEFVLERLGIAERAVRLGRDTGDEDTVCWGHWWRMSAFMELGRRAPLSAELVAFSAAVEHLREPIWIWRLDMARAAQAAFEGRYEQARSLVERAHAIGRRGGNDSADFVSLVLRSHLAVRTGDGLPHIEEAVRGIVEHGPFLARAWLAVVLDAAGQDEECAALWSSIVPQLTTFPRNAAEWMASAAGNASLCLRFGDRETAPILYDLLHPYADRWLSGDPYYPNEGPVSLYLGMLAAIQEDWPTGHAHLTSALAACRAMGSEPYEAMTRYQLGRLLLARRAPGDTRAAEEHLDVAVATARRLGMAPLAALAAAARRASRPALSAREEQVAALVAEGLSNRQIATRLKLSERTAENHVAHILIKLGLDSRVLIAAWYATRAGEYRPE